MLLLALVFAVLVAPRMRIETSIFALLPADERDAGAEQAVRVYTDQLARNSIFLVGAGDFASARGAAQAFADTLNSSGQFSQVRLQVDRALAQAARADLPYRGWLLSARHRDWLMQGQEQRLYDEARRALYTPAGFMRPFNASEDPLGLLSAFITEQRPPTGRARLQEDVLALSDQGMSYVLVVAQTGNSAFSVATEEAAGQAIAAARVQAQAAGATEVIGSGLIQHAAAAVARSKREMSLFSGISLIGTVLLMLLAFRTLRPLLLTALAMAFGAIAGLSACQWIFGQVHLVTLVFGSSLIGTSVDYAIFFFADRFRQPGDWQPMRAPDFVTAGIALGYLTTALSYLALLLAPFPGLRQIATFSAVGLGVACGCVLFLLPRLARDWPVPPRALVLRLIRRLETLPRIRSPRLKILLALAALLFIGGGLLRLHFLDDVRALQSSPPALLAQEARMRELLGQSPDRRFFLVRGDSPEQVLQREEALRARLAPLLADGRLGNLLAVSNALPSLQLQAANHALLVRKVYAPDGLLPRLLRELGYGEDAIAKQLADFAAGQRAAAAAGLLRKRRLGAVPPAVAGPGGRRPGQRGDPVRRARRRRAGTSRRRAAGRAADRQARRDLAGAGALPPHRPAADRGGVPADRPADEPALRLRRRRRHAAAGGRRWRAGAGAAGLGRRADQPVPCAGAAAGDGHGLGLHHLPARGARAPRAGVAGGGAGHAYRRAVLRPAGLLLYALHPLQRRGAGPGRELRRDPGPGAAPRVGPRAAQRTVD